MSMWYDEYVGDRNKGPRRTTGRTVGDDFYIQIRDDGSWDEETVEETTEETGR